MNNSFYSYPNNSETSKKLLNSSSGASVQETGDNGNSYDNDSVLVVGSPSSISESSSNPNLDSGLFNSKGIGSSYPKSCDTVCVQIYNSSSPSPSSSTRLSQTPPPPPPQSSATASLPPPTGSTASSSSPVNFDSNQDSHNLDSNQEDLDDHCESIDLTLHYSPSECDKTQRSTATDNSDLNSNVHLTDILTGKGENLQPSQNNSTESTDRNSSNSDTINFAKDDPDCRPARHLVHWFRKGLRLHDQPALLKGLQGCETFRCIYLIDPWFSTQYISGINKWRFLIQSLEDLDNNLHKLGSRLFVIRGQPAEIFPPLFKEWSTTHLSFEEDPEPFGKIRDAKIAKMCKEMDIEVICETSHTLYKLEDIIDRCGGEIPLTYLQFQSIVSELHKPEEPVKSINPELIGQAYTPISLDHAKKFAVPTLEELGFNGHSGQRSVWIGGETEALQRLARHLEHKAWIATFGKPKLTSISLLGAPQTGLGPYLRFGCISPRLLYYQLLNLYSKLKKGSPPLTLFGQLLWREFFYCVATNNPNFDKMSNNPLCVQIAWNSNSEALSKWANGQTGYPWIDAIQTQLRREGWIHQIAKHATVCFLTRGILWISWEEGMKVFDELLIDADWSVNAGTWMWLSCSSFFQRICHIYCPVSFGRKMDPQGDYIRRYLPVLRNIPNEYIHEPWKAPIKVQKEANCKIGKHYPQPIVNHQEAMRINQERMKQVFRILIKGLDLQKET